MIAFEEISVGACNSLSWVIYIGIAGLNPALQAKKNYWIPLVIFDGEFIHYQHNPDFNIISV